MRRSDTHRLLTCATCGLRITAVPTFVVGQAFCCTGCSRGGPCVCSYDLDDDPHVRHCLDIAALVADGDVRGARPAGRGRGPRDLVGSAARRR